MVFKILKRLIQFRISEGEINYITECSDLPIVTQGQTLDELVDNIQKAIELYLEGENLEELDLAPNFTTLVNFELGEIQFFE